MVPSIANVALLILTNINNNMGKVYLENRQISVWFTTGLFFYWLIPKAKRFQHITDALIIAAG